MPVTVPVVTTRVVSRGIDVVINFDLNTVISTAILPFLVRLPESPMGEPFVCLPCYADGNSSDPDYSHAATASSFITS